MGMVLCMEKSDMLVTRSGKQHMTEGIELPHQEKIKPLGKVNLQVLGNIDSGHHQNKWR